MGTISYDKDVILWAQEQAALLRSGQFSQLDIEHLADMDQLLVPGWLPD